MELIQTLVKEYSVSEHQAKGGVGAVLHLIRDQVPSGIFDEVKRMVPDAEGWMALSPEGRSEGFFSVLDNVFSSVAGGHLEAGARMGGHFQSLGISTRLVAPFTKQVLNYLQHELPGRAGEEIGRLLDQFQP